ncbi:glycosyltransferase family 2 protein [Aeromonas bivalvium]|uniref:glycosyltransferase family 2 protein n=1 Tax=Aeromonas bivalvium TaxID=440079 RepID=UPI003D223B08
MKFTAAINCFNEEQFIEISIKSIYKHVDEIVIVDNSSTDDTVKIIKDIISNYDLDKKIKLFPLSIPMQLASARNFCMSKVSNEWVVKWDGDFIAYDENHYESNVRSFSDLKEIILNKKNEYDVFLLHSINLSGDIYHFDKRRKYLGEYGDSFIVRNGYIHYTVDKYPDTGHLVNCNGEVARKYYLNKPNRDPIFFLHAYGVKPIEYHLYRSFMSKYQIWLEKNNNSFDFWQWLKEIEKKDIKSAISYTKDQMLRNLEAHNLSIPLILASDNDKDNYTVIYNGNNVIDRVEGRNNSTIRLYLSEPINDIFDTKNIEEYLSRDAKNIINLLSSQDFLNNIHYRFCKGEGFIAKLDLVRKIYNHIEKLGLTFTTKSPEVFSNLLYIAPNNLDVLQEIEDYIPKIPLHLLRFLLSSSEVAIQILRKIYKIGSINADSAFLLCLANTVYSNSPSEEISRLTYLKNKINDRKSSYYQAIVTRELNLKTKITSISSTSVESLKVLLLVGGQLRNYKTAMKSWENYFSNCDTIDCHISTWNKSGVKEFSVINKEHELPRFFDTQTLDAFHNGHVSMAQLETLYKDNYPSTNIGDDEIQEIQEILSWTKNISIFIHDENCDEIKPLTNPEKYFFHHKHLYKEIINSEKYDVVIKLRPDLELHTTNNIHDEINNIKCSSFSSDSAGYFMAPWGFGVGDQMLMFTKENIELFLDPLSKYEILKDIMSVFGKSTYAFHTTLALGAWLHGLSSAQFKKYTKKRLNS